MNDNYRNAACSSKYIKINRNFLLRFSLNWNILALDLYVPMNKGSRQILFNRIIHFGNSPPPPCKPSTENLLAKKISGVFFWMVFPNCKLFSYMQI